MLTSLSALQILPALYNALGKAFDASPTELGYLTLSRALVQACASPLGGVAGVVTHLHEHDAVFLLSCYHVSALSSSTGTLCTVIRAGHYMNRIKVTAYGCLLWGCMTAGFGLCSSVPQGIFFWGMNGIGEQIRSILLICRTNHEAALFSSMPIYLTARCCLQG